MPSTFSSATPTAFAPTTTDLWAARAAGDLSARDALITEHYSLVHHVAQQVSRSLAADTDFDELVSSGSIGLIGAIEHFDPSRGLAFSTFAVPRIRGAILDELRRQDHVPRSVRRKAREIKAARAHIARALGRAPDASEVAAHLGVGVDTLWRWEAELESAVQVPLDRPARDRDRASATRGPSGLDLACSAGTESVDAAITRTQESELLRRALLGLKDQERTILTMYYFEELKLHEIAELLGLTESRVSQLRTKALANMKDACGELQLSA